MYGMVTKAIGELICDRYGEDTWELIKEKASVDIDVFISNDPYPDEITYSLVGTAAAVLQLPAEAILKEFGRYWILETAQRGYADLLRAGGKTLPEFLHNLPSLHTRVAMIFPDLCPPRFACSDSAETSLRLHYHTHRPGLTAFTEGLILGLGTLFGMELHVELLESKAAGADHDVFLIQWPLPMVP